MSVITPANPANLTILETIGIALVVIKQHAAEDAAFETFRTNRNEANREAWKTRLQVARAATQAMTDALRDAGTPIDFPLRLTAGKQTIIVRLYRLTDYGRLSVQLVVDGCEVVI